MNFFLYFVDRASCNDFWYMKLCNFEKYSPLIKLVFLKL